MVQNELIKLTLWADKSREELTKVNSIVAAKQATEALGFPVPISSMRVCLKGLGIKTQRIKKRKYSDSKPTSLKVALLANIVRDLCIGLGCVVPDQLEAMCKGLKIRDLTTAE